MPIVCGVEATKMIRALESATLNATPLSISPKALSRHSTESFEERMHGWDEETPPTGIRRSNTSDLVERTVRTPLLPPNSISSPGDRLPTRRREHSGSGEQSYFPHIRPRASYRTLNVTSPPLQKSPSPVFVRPLNKPIPIFAVSANLNQHSQESLEAAGFDGWLSKPIDYTRLGIVLRGSLSEEARAAGRYSKRDPKAGGWFR